MCSLSARSSVPGFKYFDVKVNNRLLCGANVLKGDSDFPWLFQRALFRPKSRPMWCKQSSAGLSAACDSLARVCTDNICLNESLLVC